MTALLDALDALRKQRDHELIHKRTFDSAGRLLDMIDRVEHLARQAAIDLDTHRKPDRGVLLAMAATIAGGMCADSTGPKYLPPAGTACAPLTFTLNMSSSPAVTEPMRQLIAETSVDIARRIMAIIDKPEESKP